MVKIYNFIFHDIKRYNNRIKINIELKNILFNFDFVHKIMNFKFSLYSNENR